MFAPGSRAPCGSLPRGWPGRSRTPAHSGVVCATARRFSCAGMHHCGALSRFRFKRGIGHAASGWCEPGPALVRCAEAPTCRGRNGAGGWKPVAAQHQRRLLGHPRHYWSPPHAYALHSGPARTASPPRWPLVPLRSAWILGGSSGSLEPPQLALPGSSWTAPIPEAPPELLKEKMKTKLGSGRKCRHPFLCNDNVNCKPPKIVDIFSTLAGYSGLAISGRDPLFFY